jgi:hypothetical protein
MQQITITASSGLDKSEVERMVKEAKSHASEDAQMNVGFLVARPVLALGAGVAQKLVRGVCVALLIPVIVGLGGCVVAPAYPPPPPAAGVVWVPGYYAPAPVGHIWISGHWRIR